MSSETAATVENRRTPPAPRSVPGPDGLANPLGSRAFLAGIALILVVAAVVRLPMIVAASGSYRLTEAFNTEETESIRLSTGMIHNRSLNPHAFLYPSLHYDVSLAAELPLAAAGRLNWTSALIGVRSISLLFGLGTVFLVGLLAGRIGGTWAGLLAAALTAFDRTLIQSAALAKPDSMHVFLVMGGFVALAALAAQPRFRVALAAAAWFGLAAATKWFGGIGLLGVALAPALARSAGPARGLARLATAIRAALGERITAVQLAAPLLVFAAVFVLVTPYALLSPREFAFGFAISFTAQGLHQRDLPMLTPLVYLARSLGPVGVTLAASGLLWALARLARWDGSPRGNALLLVTGWALAYGLLVLFVFVKLPSYMDLWVPFLAVLAGWAWAGDGGILRQPGLRAALLAAAVLSGAFSNGAWSAARAASVDKDTRTASARWLHENASPADPVLADHGTLVPDDFRSVNRNAWGSPPRVMVDETATWGTSRIWPEWHGGHRRLMFENAKWTPPMELLARRPRWVVTSDEWAASRARPGGASETAAPDYDASLADGRAGYVERARFEAQLHEGNPWSALMVARDPGSPRLLGGPRITIYERVDAAR